MASLPESISERSAFAFRFSTASKGGSARAWRSTRCSARRTTPTTPRRATPITCGALADGHAQGPGRRRRRRRTRSRRIALDTTGSSVIPGGRQSRAARRLLPLVRPPRLAGGRRDHRARRTRRTWRPSSGAAASTPREWGFAKLLHWLRHNPDEARALRHRAGTLRHGGGRAVRHHRPRAGAAQRLRHGPQVDVERRARRPAARGVPHRRRSAAGGRARETGRRATPPATRSPAQLRAEWAEKLGLRAGIPIPVGAFDAHWDAIGAGVPHGRRGERGRHLHLHHGHQRRARADSRASAAWCRARSIPRYTGIEAGLSATGDIFEAIARRAGTTVARTVRAASRTTAPARPACCASPGTTATAPCW